MAGTPEAAATPQPTGKAAAERVAAYLRAHPGFLAAHPELLEGQDAPRRTLGTGVADFQEFLIERLRGEVRRLTEAERVLVGERREARSLTERVQKATLALIAAQDLTLLIEAVTIDLAVLLGVDVAALAVETDDAARAREPVAGVRCLTEGAVDGLIGEVRDVLIVPDGRADARVFGAGAGLVRSAVLARVGGRRGLPNAVLGIGSRRAGRFHANVGAESFRYLAEVLEHCLRTRLGLPT